MAFYLDSNKIKDGSITSGKLADGSVSADKIAGNAISVAKLADNAVTAAKLADNAVTTAKIADGSITEGKLANTFTESLGDVKKLEVKENYTEHGFIYVDTDSQEAYNALNSGKLVTYNIVGMIGIALTGYVHYNSDGNEYYVVGVMIDGTLLRFFYHGPSDFELYSNWNNFSLHNIDLGSGVGLTDEFRTNLRTALTNVLAPTTSATDGIITVKLCNGQVGDTACDLSLNGDTLYIKYSYDAITAGDGRDDARPPLNKVFVNDLILNLEGYTETSPLRIVPEWFKTHATTNSKVMVCGDKLTSDGTFMVHIVSLCDGTNFTCWQTVSKKVDEFDGSDL